MTLRSRKAKFPGLETQKTDLFDPYSHHYVSRTLGNEYQLINTLPEAKHSGRGIRLWGYSSVTWTGRLVRIKCACSKIYVNLKWIPVSQYSGFKNSKKVILHQHNLKNTAVETQERVSANSWVLTQLNTTVSEYLNQNRASLKRPAYPCTLTRSIQNWLCHMHFWKSFFLHLPCDSARFISNPCSPLLVCAKAPLSLEQTQHTNTQLCFPQIDLTFCTLFTLLCLAPPYPHPPFPAPSAPDLCPV